MMTPAFEPLVFVVSGPSGSGKSTLVEKLRELPGMHFSVSCTTRPPRAGERPGEWYRFVSVEEFEQMIAAGSFLEYARVFGKHYYGTPRESIEEARRAKRDLVLEIDVQGAALVKSTLRAENRVSIFILPPSRQSLEARIRARGLDSEEEIARRLRRAHEELQRYSEYDYIVVNDELERAGREVQSIALAARCRDMRPALRERIQSILESFGG
jgi:guanylate kinase